MCEMQIREQILSCLALLPRPLPQSPRTPHDHIYVLPLLTILTNKASQNSQLLLPAPRHAQRWALPPVPQHSATERGQIPAALRSQWRSHHALLPGFDWRLLQGTGIVTSVPSDAPDDYAALMDLGEPHLKPCGLGCSRSGDRMALHSLILAWASGRASKQGEGSCACAPAKVGPQSTTQ